MKFTCGSIYKKLKTPFGVLDFYYLTSIDVNLIAIFVNLLYHLIGNERGIFTQEATDLLSGSGAVRSRASKPTVLDSDNTGGVGNEINTVGMNHYTALCVGHITESLVIENHGTIIQSALNHLNYLFPLVDVYIISDGD
jgi:hypothetical protein